ncbi:MAG TPA: elongation factor P [Thermomicrobiaceae bacterium]|nr:elongation factor P [Thermomicrobiaceae bacterium]
MIDTGGLRKGLTLDMNGELVRVVDYQHVKQGRGSAFVRLTLRNIRTGSTTQQTYQAGAKFQTIRLERQRVQYLYNDEGHYHFMDLDTFEQFALDREALGDAMNYLIENETLDLLTYQDQPIDVELPITVNLTVAETEPGVKGDTAAGGTKPARLETGVNVNVPLFVNIGDVIKVDTRSGAYLERVS